jgi:hypothetical protein
MSRKVSSTASGRWYMVRPSRTKRSLGAAGNGYHQAGRQGLAFEVDGDDDTPEGTSSPRRRYGQLGGCVTGHPVEDARLAGGNAGRACRTAPKISAVVARRQGV